MKKPWALKLTRKQIVRYLILFSVVMYAIHYLIFRDFHHIAIFFVHDIAFLPLEVILVSMVFDRLLERVGEEENLSKLSIIETLFFNESGGNILRYLISFDPKADELRSILDLSEDWKSSDYISARKQLLNYPFKLDFSRVDFFGLHYHLNERRNYYRNILENPALTQSNEFTEMVMKIYLMWEELDCRTDLYALSDEEHIYLGDLLTEIYEELTFYWLDNAYNHSVHNRHRLHRLIQTNPFVS